MIFAIEFEKYVANASVFSVVVDKLRHGKKSCLIILLKIDENLEIGFHCTILPLNPAICLWIKGSW